ncbi:MAG: hypothetical protein RIR79_1302 [Pseudomonadota bacterium]|jgi:superfamily II DNA or RNA helicase
MYLSLNLEEERRNNPNYTPKIPFEHQTDAFTNLSKIFDFKEKHKSGMLVLPTGAGKTYTSVNWICRNVLPKNIKVLWLAHTSHLLEQAFEEFEKNLLEIHKREGINIRVVSSNPIHYNAADIKLTDDVVIITTQTAISNWNLKALDGNGKIRETAFEKYINHSKNTGLFLVLDEAHHAPAYGCRNLLIGGSKEKGIRDTIPNIRDTVSNSSFLGLTATPTYNDERRRGWLFEIFNTELFNKKGIIYEADKAKLTKDGILAIPEYIQKNTGEEFEVDDRTYNHLVREHKDLPEDLIDRMASDSKRNDYIVDEYIKNKNNYKKTIIFADRWFQCVYIKEKLKNKGIKKVDAIYTHVEGAANSAEQRNRRTPAENSKILQDFKENKLDVLINVRMLTEGTDVPNVNTVFITRQTTSSIMLTQMIGRALRGKKANGGKETANIVFFTDNWKRIIDFAIPENEGDKSNDEIKVKGNYPIQYIAIRLVEELSRKIDSGYIFADKDFLEQLPLGWYETEITINVEEETNTFKEFVIVYPNMQEKFEKFIKGIFNNLSSEWENENLSDEWMRPHVSSWIDCYFDKEQDDKNKTLDLDLIRIARHIAQSGKPPVFFTFEERNKHDLSQIAFDAVNMNYLTIHEMLFNEFNSPDKLWKSLYKDFHRFSSAFDAELKRAVHKIKYNSNPKISTPQPEIAERKRELTEPEKEQVFIRDRYTCLCCGKTKTQDTRARFEVDHIIPFKFGGQTTIDNSQTLCSICNQAKRVDEINFRVYKTPLSSPKDNLETFSLSNSEYIEWHLRRIINIFYHCQAASEIKLDTKLYIYKIKLYEGNNPAWLEKHKEKLIEFIHNNLGYKLLKDLTIQ